MVSPTQLCWRYHSLPLSHRYVILNESSRYLIPVFSMLDFAAEMYNCLAALLLFVYFSILLQNSNMVGTLCVWYLYLKRPMRYLFMPWNCLILSWSNKGSELILNFTWELVQTTLFWRRTGFCKFVFYVLFQICLFMYYSTSDGLCTTPDLVTVWKVRIDKWAVSHLYRKRPQDTFSRRPNVNSEDVHSVLRTP